MPEEQQVPISSFPDASSIDGADTVTGLQNNVNTNFKFSTILAWLVNAFRAAFVPAGRTVNNKSLASDITLNAQDVGARPNNWTPSAADVGAIPTTAAGEPLGVAELDSSGKVPSSQLPASPAADVTYDNTGSGLSASDVQDALDELAAGAGGSTAATTSYDNTGSGLAATNAQDAIDELSDEKADQITVAPVETSTTASAAHGLGSVFYLGGKLYRALADIAAGGTINTAAGGNATETSIEQNFKRTVTLTSAQYAQLSAAEKAADIVYIITDEPAPSAYTSNPEMDGTASPGSSEAWARGDHVHPSDSSKANQAQLAYVETGTTASRNYSVGEYFCWNGLLYRAKTAISSGGTITPGKNCEQVTGGGLNALGNQVIVRSKSMSTSISTGLNEWTVAVDSIPGYTAIGVVGMQFAAIPRDRVNITHFYTDGTNVVLSCMSTVSYASGRSVNAYVLYGKN